MDWFAILLPIATAILGLAAERLGLPNPFKKPVPPPANPDGTPAPAPEPVKPSDRPFLDAILKLIRDELDKRLPRLPLMMETATPEPKLFTDAARDDQPVITQRMGHYVVTIRPQVEVSLAQDDPQPA